MRFHLRAFVSLSVLLVLAACSKDKTDFAVYEDTHKCDELAAHPDDPGKFALGVEEDKLIPGLAVKACKEAVAEHPGTPRFQFQLGRVLIAGNDHVGAAEALASAAEAGYAPAYAYLADMYRFGALGEEDQEKAAEYYELASAGGFKPAEDALREMLEGESAGYAPAAAAPPAPAREPQSLARRLAPQSAQRSAASGQRPPRAAELIGRGEYPLRNATSFDPSHFSQGRILSWLYDGDFDTLNARREFADLVYMAHLNNHFLEPVNFNDPACTSYGDPELSRDINNAGLDAVGMDENFQIKPGAAENILGQLADMARSGPGKLLSRVHTFEIMTKAARADGGKLALLYGCASPVFDRLYTNMKHYLRGQEPAAASGWAALRLGCYKHARANGGAPETSKETCHCITGKFRAAGLPREQAEWFGAHYDHGENFARITKPFGTLKKELAGCLLARR